MTTVRTYGGARPRRQWAAALVLGLALAGCVQQEAPPTPEVPIADQPFPLAVERGLARVNATGDPLAVSALVGANPDFGPRIVSLAVTAHPMLAPAIAGAAASARPELAPALAAAAATANPLAAPQIARRATIAVPESAQAIHDAVLAALLPDERQAMEAQIAGSVREAAPLTVDEWALKASMPR